MIVFLYLLSLFALAIYSYSQIDLNLTLLQSSWFLNFQKTMISLGYFNRLLSTAIFLLLIVLLTIFYIYFHSKSEKLSKNKLLLLLGGLSVLALFSYPAFSHDIFNYLFDARIALFHHANPYTSTALMFPDDTWTRFMQWTHRTYPYGPIFLPLTFPFYFLGFGKFLLTLVSFKILMAAAYVGSTILIFKLAKAKGAIMFALNPLIIIEVLIAGHLDIVMLFFVLAAFWFFLKNKKLIAWILFVLSIGIKYSTVLFAPIFLFPKYFARNILWVLFGLSLLGSLIQVISRELLPHYFIVSIGFSALIPNEKRLVRAIVIASLIFLLVRYLPFFYNGTWWELKLFTI